jgi:hypothetical protein
MVKFQEQTNLAETSVEGYGSKRALFSVMMMINRIVT